MTSFDGQSVPVDPPQGQIAYEHGLIHLKNDAAQQMPVCFPTWGTLLPGQPVRPSTRLA
jgi:hypothetical protein